MHNAFYAPNQFVVCNTFYTPNQFVVRNAFYACNTFYARTHTVPYTDESGVQGFNIQMVTVYTSRYLWLQYLPLGIFGPA